MKKVSTTARCELGKFAGQRLTMAGPGRPVELVLRFGRAGELLVEQKVATTPKAMKEVFGAMPRSRIALETGMHSPWVSRALSELGHEVIVTHARNVRLIGESRKKHDRLDAHPATPTRLNRSSAPPP